MFFFYNVILSFSGHSHFEVVIERLKQAQGEESENDEPINLTGKVDDVAATDINV